MPLKLSDDTSQSNRAMWSSLLTVCAGFAVLRGCMWGKEDWDIPNRQGLGSVALAILLSLIAISWWNRHEDQVASDARRWHWGWIVLACAIAFHAITAVHRLNASPATKIDCFTFQRDASANLLHGIDPFGATQADIYGPEETARFYGPGMVIDGRVQVGFQYPPLTLYWALPGYLLGDVRYSYILAAILSAVWLFAANPGLRNLFLSLCLLLSPLTFFVEERCWTEPLVLMTLSAALYAALKNRWWLPIALGLFLASKQYNVLALPFLAFFVRPFAWKPYLRLVGYSALAALATVLPFLFWNAPAVWHDLVLFHFAQPFRKDALSFAVPIPIALKLGPVVLVAFMLWCVRKGARNSGMFAAAYGVSLLLFVATGKQAFRNYYFLIGHVLLLAVAASPSLPTASWIGSGIAAVRSRGKGNGPEAIAKV